MSFEPIRLSTDDLPEKDRSELIREFYGRIVQRLDISAIEKRSLSIDAFALPLDSVMIAGGAFGPIASERTSELLTDGIDDVVLSINTKPFQVSTARHGSIAINPGEVLVTSIGRPLKVTMPSENNQMLTIQISRKRLSEFGGFPEPRDTGKVNLLHPQWQFLFDYARLVKQTPLGSEQLRLAISDHLVRLAAIALDARDEPERIAASLAAGWILRIKNDVRANLYDHDLSAETIGSRLGISARYVRKLFESEPTSLLEFINTERCEWVLRRLQDPNSNHLKIADIAYEAGYAEVTSFNRIFRRIAGMTPSGARLKTMK